MRCAGVCDELLLLCHGGVPILAHWPVRQATLAPGAPLRRTAPHLVGVRAGSAARSEDLSLNVHIM